MREISRIILCSICFIVLYVHAYTQEVKITKLEINETHDVIIHYDLIDDNADRRYTLRLYNSIDNYIQPLEKVEGDIGVGIPVGEGVGVGLAVGGGPPISPHI